MRSPFATCLRAWVSRGGGASDGRLLTATPRFIRGMATHPRLLFKQRMGHELDLEGGVGHLAQPDGGERCGRRERVRMGGHKEEEGGGAAQGRHARITLAECERTSGACVFALW